MQPCSSESIQSYQGHVADVKGSNTFRTADTSSRSGRPQRRTNCLASVSSIRTSPLSSSKESTRGSSTTSNYCSTVSTGQNRLDRSPKAKVTMTTRTELLPRIKPMGIRQTWRKTSVNSFGRGKSKNEPSSSSGLATRKAIRARSNGSRRSGKECGTWRSDMSGTARTYRRGSPTSTRSEF
jgi:hypothetical protein